MQLHATVTPCISSAARCTRQASRDTRIAIARPSSSSRCAHSSQRLRPAPSGSSPLATRVVAVERSSETGSNYDQPHMMAKGISRIATLLDQLRDARDIPSKVSVLMASDAVVEFLDDPRHEHVTRVLQRLPLSQQLVLLSLPAIGQSHVLQQREAVNDEQLKENLQHLASVLLRVEVFYDGIGGVVGYHLKSLQLIHGAGPQQDSTITDSEVETRHLVPKAVDLTGQKSNSAALQAVAQGLQAMPFLAEIYPVGGAGDRLGLKCDVTGEALPAAMLHYSGRTMLEGLLRDLQAREFLYFKLTGKQLTTPVAIMTSDAKGNNSHIRKLMQDMDWFGRGKDAFKLFRQPLVPVLSVEDGQWLLADPMRPMLKPGGHGAIWKLMKDEGVFDWMLNKWSRKAALVRQISNPMAGTDSTLLALSGCGASRNATFGFMSCDRHVGAAEGMNVLQEHKVKTGDGVKYKYGITNIEYTEFERLGITDQAADDSTSTSAYPANTNILYVGLAAAQAVIHEAVAEACSEKLMPGLIFNLKKTVSYLNPLSGEETKIRAGRMESTMQNMADFLADTLDAPLEEDTEASDSLSTFLVYGSRKKVTSSAKKKRAPGSLKIAQTPDGSFYDLMQNALQILEMCGMSKLPSMGSIEQYLEKGPGFILLFHPALGPLWSVISQKIRGGSLSQGSELVLEVSELSMRDVHVNGSLLVKAENILGAVGPRTSSSTHLSMPMGGDGDEGLQHVPGFPKSEPIVRSNCLVNADVDSMGSSDFDSVASADLYNAEDSAEEADSPEPLLLYSNTTCGRVRLSNVIVENRGVNWESPDNLYWRHKVERHESLRITLRGRSEFEAQDVTLRGDLSFDVPDGFRMVVTQDNAGMAKSCLYPLDLEPSWMWQYKMDSDGAITLSC